MFSQRHVRALRVAALLSPSSAMNRVSPSICLPLFRSSKLFSTMSNIRNLGIIAHIDAGKTTLTERMLLYANMISQCGEVHNGDTVMDFLPQERERGITISSAAISFAWQQHRFNLVDTPGHVDFTIEVERSLRVLDGALVVLDSCSGVEAQTQTVWRQADKRKVAKVVVANKLDRDGASVWTCKQSLENRLGATPLLLYMPVGESSKLSGFIDLLSMQYVTFGDDKGKTVHRVALTSSTAPGNSPSEPTHAAPEHSNENNRTIWQDAVLARERLIEKLADLDDELASMYLDQPELLHWDQKDSLKMLKRAIRKATVECRAVPIICASAFKNKGVQLAMDAAVDYLPSPADRSSFPACSLPAHTWADHQNTKNLVALAFKVVHDKQKGFLTYLRVYSGSLKARDNLLNTGSALLSGAPTGAKLNRSQRLKSLAQFPKERAMRLVEVFGSDMADIEEVGSGNICAALGLKNVKTGDTLIHAQQATQGDGESVLALAGIDTPEPVFFCSIEAESQSEQAKLDEALKCIMQEDPSVSLTTDVDTGQTLLRGMGELHLEIVYRRLVDDFKCKITMGSVRVAYRETIDGEFQHEASIDRVVAGRAAFAKVNLVVKPGELGSGIAFTFSETVQPPLAEGEVEADEDDNQELLKQKRKAERLNKGKRSDDSAASASPNDDDEAGDGENSAMTLKAIREAIVLGAEAALSRGTLLNYPMTDVVVHFESVEQNSNSTAPAFRQAASQAISQSLRALKTSSAVSLLEPVMAADLSVQHAHVPLVLNDLVDRRRATIGDVINRGSDVGQPSLIHALVPLSEMIGYASAIRSLTQGNASFTMRFAEYQKVQAHHLKKLLANPPA